MSELEFHPPDLKLTSQKPISVLPTPKLVVLPLQQHTGALAQPVVSVGDKVKKGQIIGDSNQYVFAPIHSSIGGKVKSITPWLHPTLGREVDSIIIEEDVGDEELRLKPLSFDASPQEITLRAREAGLVGLGGAAFPTAVKLSPNKPIDVVIINGAECEPYLTIDHRQMLENPEKLIQGLKLIMKAVMVKKGIIAIEDNKRDAIKVMLELVKNENNLEVSILPTQYPQGAEKVLIKTLLKREVPRGGLPMDVGAVVFNVSTTICLAEAVFEGKVLTDRVITISGDLISEPANVRVTLGTQIKDIAENFLQLSDEKYKVVMGGPMTGITQSSLEVPVIKGTSGILFLKKKVDNLQGECIRCGRCVKVCPMRLMPIYITQSTKLNEFSKAEYFGAMDCFECGSCAYVCPASIPLVHYVKVAKAEIFAKRKASVKT